MLSGGNFAEKVRDQVRKVLVGQDVALERVLIGLLTGGHVLLEGKPGVAKTLLVSCVAHAIGQDFRRLQCTIDLLPGDIIGSLVFDQSKNRFRKHNGPIFTNFLFVDEINRAAPRVQSALLEAMQERQVTIGRRSYPLPAPFVVIATQNPIEQSGTFELPEAQLDRFMLRHHMDYPSEDDEIEVLARTLKLPLPKESEQPLPQSLFDSIKSTVVAVTREELKDAMRAVWQVTVNSEVMRYAVQMARRTREPSARLEVGCSPRAAISLLQAARARAFLHRRTYVSLSDLEDLAEDVMLHRVRRAYQTLIEGIPARKLLRDAWMGEASQDGSDSSAEAYQQ